MVTTLWVCRKTKARGDEEEEGRNAGSLATCIIKTVKQICMWRTKKKRRIRQLNLHLHLQEKKHHHHHHLLSKNNNTEEQLVTLEEWILASPSLNLSFINNNSNVDEGDSINRVVVCKKTSNNSNNNSRVHPSFNRNLQLGSCHLLAKSRENLIISNMETSARLKEESDPEVVATSSSLCCSTTQSGKIKKKVSFRLPQVADIFMLDSPEGHFENV